MSSLFYRKASRFIFPLMATLVCLADTNGTGRLEIESGVASFIATTSVPGVDVKGKSSALTARASVSRQEASLRVQSIEASLPTGSLGTGMKVRDEHMRKYIFSTADGQEPDIRFSADQAECPASAHEFSCPISGRLRIRGVERPFEISLRVKEQSSGAFRAEGDGIIRLSDYGIEAPSQLGVKVANEVKWHVGFIAKNTSTGADR